MEEVKPVIMEKVEFHYTGQAKLLLSFVNFELSKFRRKDQTSDFLSNRPCQY